MNNFELYNLETASQAAKPLLENSVKGFGMIPNLHAVMAESPALLEAYQTLHGLAQDASFNNEELTVVWQTINVEHACHYCVPAHTAIANMMNVDADITEALRNQTPLKSTKLETLRDTTLLMVRNRGVIEKADIDTFYAAGFSKQNLLDIVLVLAQKVMSNFTNHLADTAVDEPFKVFAWNK
ncbi:MAG: alkylhydroperoxidase family enzyme [Paraglaciecola sp.]|jgi:alkylhydroperoxidase family enzyme